MSYLQSLPFIRPFRRLRWKLTFSYTFITLSTLLVLELLLAIGLLALSGSTFFGNLISSQFETAFLPTVANYLQAEPTQTSDLQAWVSGHVNKRTVARLDGTFGEDENFRVGNVSIDVEEFHLWVLDSEQNVAAQFPETSTYLWADRPNAADFVQTAYQGPNEADEPYTLANRDGTRLLALPVTACEAGDSLCVGEVEGMVLVQYRAPLLLTRESLEVVLGLLLITAVPLTIIAGLIGTLFGFLTSRGLTKRILNLREVADAWSQGDFAPVALDESADELGDLSRRLNRMAGELQHLVSTRQELAAVDTRNGLARDLHDSVKQQLFAVTMQLGAAKTRLEQAPDQARQHLLEAEQLAKQSQQELTGLIQALRPPMLEDKGLAEALRLLVADWSRQTRIPAEIQVQGEQTLPLTIETVYYRIAQEALSNVSRHSHATAVLVRLHMDDAQVRLRIEDNGLGFVPEEVSAGMGLKSMAERLAGINGRLQVTSEPKRGSTILAIVDRSEEDNV